MNSIKTGVYSNIEHQKMKTETIKEITVNDKNELSLKIHGEGNVDYQYVYREAAGVYWNKNQKAFESTPIREWTISQWFWHICEVTKIGLGVELALDRNVKWGNIPEQEKNKIKRPSIKNKINVSRRIINFVLAILRSSFKSTKP